MHRISGLALAALIGTAVATAGQIQIGNGTNGVNGLTSSYIGTGNAGGAWFEQNYQVRLFQTSKSGTALVSPQYATGSYTETTSPSPATIVDTGTGALTNSSTGVTFNMINDGTSTGFSNNFWEATGANTITIPVGVFDVNDVWTLMNNLWGAPVANDTTVTFNFGNSATTATESLTVQLINAGNTTGGNATPGGQIATSVQCTTTVAATCNSFAIGPTAASSSLTTSGTASGALPSISVLTDTLLEGNYTTSAGNYAGSAGQIVMTDQGFQFGAAFSNLYLVNVQVAESVGVAHQSETALSAITVDAGATPEPSTIWLLVTGFGAVAATRFRRKKN